MHTVHVQSQRAARIGDMRAEGRFGILEFGQDTLAALIEGLPVQGRLDVTGRAIQQSRPQPALHLLDGVCRGRTRQIQHFCGFCKAAEFDDSIEQLQGKKSIHGASVVTLVKAR